MNLLSKIIAHKNYSLILVAVLVIFSLMRLLFINADAPQDLSISAAIYTDEGFKTFAARNFLLFGDWRWTPVDEYASWFSQSPVGTMSYVYIFTLFESGFASIRGLSVAYSIATLILFYIFMIRNYKRETAFTSLLIFGVNYFNTMSGRLGFFETHLNFFVIMSFLLGTELLKAMKKKKYLPAVILGFGAALTIVVQYFLKKNFLIIPIAMIPAAILHIMKSGNRSAVTSRRVLFAVIFLSALFYLLFAHFSFMQGIMSEVLSIKIFGMTIEHFLPVRLFDPLPAMLGKGIYLEFIFLQPLTFALGMFYGVYALYSYIHDGADSTITDLYLSSWLLFGFILLTLLAYHPSRYYQLFSIPLAVCAGRALTGKERNTIADFFGMKKPLPFNVMTLVLYITLLVYSSVVLLVQAVPFSARSALMRILYPALVNGRVADVYHIIIPVASAALFIIVFLFLARRRIKRFFLNENRAGFILLLILALQFFQYGRWALSRDYTLYETSKALGKELPADSIIIGSWSSGLSIENRLRPLIIQAGNTYNYNVIDSLLRGEPITVMPEKGSPQVVQKELNSPLIFAVSRNVIFERPIVERFGPILTSDKLMKTVTLGYFDVELYRLR